MFLSEREVEKISYYKNMLQSVGALSRLFSDSETPYLYYRLAENLFCKSFGAENLSRSDVAIDASYGSIGIGLKTFLKTSDHKLEKVAEFNSHSARVRTLQPEEQVYEIIRLRNERLQTSLDIYGLDTLLYHCVVREAGQMSFVETPMDSIDINSLQIISVSDKSLKFKDLHSEYSFNLSKSTLFKKFNVASVIDRVEVLILEDPFLALERLLQEDQNFDLVFRPIDVEKNYVVLPLYSARLDENGDKVVPERSGLNQWNASGRVRNLGEVYIPIPASIHEYFPDFFPARDEQFTLELPNKKQLQAKVCQDGSKALMTNPNTDLGQWILRDVLRLAEGELLTYQKLADIGLDSVVVYKHGPHSFKIDFAKIGTFETFAQIRLQN
ncbi:MAG: NgoFVII family restriction endonuclease [Candidatus Paceibacterota bacterium]